MTTTRRNVIITDLDQSDNQQRGNDENHRKVHKKRSKEKTLQTLSGNFNRRSHSAEYSKEDRLGHGEKAGNKTTKPSSYFNELVRFFYLFLKCFELFYI